MSHGEGQGQSVCVCVESWNVFVDSQVAVGDLFIYYKLDLFRRWSQLEITFDICKAQLGCQRQGIWEKYYEVSDL